MPSAEKIIGLLWYQGENKISKGLRWVAPHTNINRHRPVLILDKDNQIVGSHAGEMPIYFDENYEHKWQGKEIKAIYTQDDYLKFVSQEEMLLHFCQALFNFAKMEVSSRELGNVTCLHIKTRFKSLADATCPECGEFVSPNLVMGSLVMAMGELNEHIWEHRPKEKDEKEAVVTSGGE